MELTRREFAAGACVGFAGMLAAGVPFAQADEQKFAGGAGTPEDPWQIATAQQLAAIAENLSANYVLVQDIELSTGENWVPLGSYAQNPEIADRADPVLDNAFTGTLDGAGHFIRHLTASNLQGAGVGLFGCLAGGALVKNLQLQNFTAEGDSYVGGLAAYAFSSTVDGVSISSTAKDGSNDCAVASNQGVCGGIVAEGSGCTIVNCSVENLTLMAGYVGNAGCIAGKLGNASVGNCTAKNCSLVAPVLMNGSGIGGLVGYLDTPAGDVCGCAAQDVFLYVSGSGELVGGLVGGLGSTLAEDGSGRAVVRDCTTQNVALSLEGTVYHVGGLVGGSPYGGPGMERKSYLVDGCTVGTQMESSTMADPAGFGIGAVAGLANLSEVTNTDSSSTTFNGGPLEAVGCTYSLV